MEHTAVDLGPGVKGCLFWIDGCWGPHSQIHLSNSMAGYGAGVYNEFAKKAGVQGMAYFSLSLYYLDKNFPPRTPPNAQLLVPQVSSPYLQVALSLVSSPHHPLLLSFFSLHSLHMSASLLFPSLADYL